MDSPLIRLLIAVALLCALLLLTVSGQRIVTAVSIALRASADEEVSLMTRFPLPEMVYPYRWQREQRASLARMLAEPDSSPTEDGELGLARYAQYALLRCGKHGNHTELIREGMRRDPQNALYHYLLADEQLSRALAGPPPQQKYFFRDHSTRLIFHYTITDREMLDRAMREYEAGLQKPLLLYRGTLFHANIGALPPLRHWEDQLFHVKVLADTPMRELSLLHRLALYKSYYLNVLANEGRYAEAERLARLSVGMVKQITAHDPPTLLHSLRSNDALVDTVDRDTAIIETHGGTGTAEYLWAMNDALLRTETRFTAREYREAERQDTLIRLQAGMIAGVLLPELPSSYHLDAEALRPSRLIEYVLGETLAIVLGLSFLLTLMLYHMLKCVRLRKALGTDAEIAPISLPVRAWLRAVGLGFVLPIILYGLFTVIPGISGRELNVMHGWPTFLGSLLLVLLWILVVPAAIVAAEIRKRMPGSASEADLQHKPSVWRRIFRSVAASIGMLILWFPLAGLPASVVVWCMRDVSITEWRSAAALGLFSLLIIAAVVRPRARETAQREQTLRQFITARALVPLYAVLLLVSNALYPLCAARERYYLQRDQVSTPVVTRQVTAFTKVEGALALEWREAILRAYEEEAERARR
jgi:hypothetical protein